LDSSRIYGRGSWVLLSRKDIYISDPSIGDE
jgi:hypothetical protein